jgi:hypothetical protein
MQTDERSCPSQAMEWIIEDGIALAAIDGQRVAAAYLAARGVPETVIARVLCEPSRRRGTWLTGLPLHDPIGSLT